MTHRKHNVRTVEEETFGLFWDEYRSIEEAPGSPGPTEEDTNAKEDYDKNETEIQWLSDVGFTNIANKIREKQTIEENDEDMQLIATSLTRSQANAVRRRIEYLNDIIQKNYQADNLPVPCPATPTRNIKDVRDIFQQRLESEGLVAPSAQAKIVPERPKSCSEEDTRKKVHQGKRNRLAKAYSVDDPTSPELPQIVLEKNLSPPPIAPKPKEQKKTPRRGVTVSNDGKQKESHAGKHRKSPEPQLGTSIPEKGRSRSPGTPSNHPSNNLGSISPVSNLTFITGEEREKLINESPKEKPSRAKVKDYRKRDNRCHSAYTDPRRGGEQKVMRKSKSVDKDTFEITNKSNVDSNVEIDGASEAIHFSDNYIDTINFSDNYIDVDDDSYDHINITNLDVNTPVRAGGLSKSKFINKVNSTDSSSHNKTSKKNNNLLPSKSIDIPHTPSDTNTTQHSTHISVPYTISSTEISVPYTLPSPQGRHRNLLTSIDVDSTPLDIDTIALDIDPSKKQTKKGYPVSSSPINQDDILKSPRETRLYTNVDCKKNKDSNVNKLSNMNNLSISPRIEHRRSGSEDSKSLSSHGSLGSMGSTDDLNVVHIETRPERRVYDDNNKGMRITRSIDRGDSPVPEGDARLDVGPETPRDPVSIPSTAYSLPKFPPLPNFNLAKDITGMTEVGDLSDADMDRVRSIALIELTALFDAYNIPMNRRKPLLKPKFRDSGVFGVHLTSLSQREENKKHREGRVPRVFKEMLIFLERNGLKEEGVLRIPGSAARIKHLREAIDKNDLNSVKWEERNVKDVAACLKQFLRDLPEPLLSHEYQNTFISVADLPDRKIQLQALNLLVILLKPVHQKTLKALLMTLGKIIENEPHNKMGLDNVAMIMAPNLLLQSGNKIIEDGQQKAEVMTDITRMLIKYQAILWTIPSFMVGQIRYVNDSGVKTKDPKTVLKIISKQRKNPNTQVYTQKSVAVDTSGDELEPFEEEIIRVKAPSLSKQSMAIKLNDNTTAADVIAKFQWRRQNSQKEKDDDVDTSRVRVDRTTGKKETKIIKYHLFESGGNIDERRLEGTANISAILKANPYAGWVLKT